VNNRIEDSLNEGVTNINKLKASLKKDYAGIQELINKE